jgi:hypothetical protein
MPLGSSTSPGARGACDLGRTRSLLKSLTHGTCCQDPRESNVVRMETPRLITPHPTGRAGPEKRSTTCSGQARCDRTCRLPRAPHRRLRKAPDPNMCGSSVRERRGRCRRDRDLTVAVAVAYVIRTGKARTRDLEDMLEASAE